MKSWISLLTALVVLLLVSGGHLLASGAVSGAPLQTAGEGMATQLTESNNDQTVTVNQGTVLQLSLPSNPTTGYSWSYSGSPDQNILLETSHFFISTTQAVVGAGDNEHWVFRATGTGTTKLNLVYSRPWESTSPAKTYSVAIGVTTSSAPPLQLNHAIFTLGSSIYNINGQAYQMDNFPFLQNGRVYVPLRYLVTALGLSTDDIYWDPASQSVILPPSKDGIVYQLKMGDSHIYQIDSGDKGSAVQDIGATPLNDNGHICIPARFIADLFGYQAGWDAVGKALSLGPVQQ